MSSSLAGAIQQCSAISDSAGSVSKHRAVMLLIPRTKLECQSREVHQKGDKDWSWLLNGGDLTCKDVSHLIEAKSF